jgi:hypothetical protein
MIMPLDAYEKLHNNFAIPLPIPKLKSFVGILDPHYVTFDKAVKHPFKNEHQPSLQNRRRYNNTEFDGVVFLGEQQITTSSEAETKKLRKAR